MPSSTINYSHAKNAENKQGVALIKQKSTSTLLRPFLKNSTNPEKMSKLCHVYPDFAVGFVTKRRKLQRNA